MVTLAVAVTFLTPSAASLLHAKPASAHEFRERPTIFCVLIKGGWYRYCSYEQKRGHHHADHNDGHHGIHVWRWSCRDRWIPNRGYVRYYCGPQSMMHSHE